MRKIIVDTGIFDLFPKFKRGVIIVEDINNELSNKRIKRPLNKEIERQAGANNHEHEYIKAWDEAHARFGSNPNTHPPSIKSLLKRIEKGGGFPFINSVVAIFNYISIKYLVPCGGDDVDTIKGNLRLGFAKGNEVFIPLGSEEEEKPETGEVIYYDDQSLNVMCRRWNWRNGDFTKITEQTKKIVINIDGVGPVLQSDIVEAQEEMAEMLVAHCSTQLEKRFIDKDNREVDITI